MTDHPARRYFFTSSVDQPVSTDYSLPFRASTHNTRRRWHMKTATKQTVNEEKLNQYLGKILDDFGAAANAPSSSSGIGSAYFETWRNWAPSTHTSWPILWRRVSGTQVSGSLL